MSFHPLASRGWTLDTEITPGYVPSAGCGGRRASPRLMIASYHGESRAAGFCSSYVARRLEFGREMSVAEIDQAWPPPPPHEQGDGHGKRLAVRLSHKSQVRLELVVGDLASNRIDCRHCRKEQPRARMKGKVWVCNKSNVPTTFGKFAICGDRPCTSRFNTVERPWHGVGYKVAMAASSGQCP